MYKQDDADIWGSIAARIKDRTANRSLRVTWTKGHVTDEHVAGGKATEEERIKNRAVDVLATLGIQKNEANGIEIKAAIQRKRMAMIQQTMLVKIWLHRQDLIAQDSEEQAALDEEAAAIAEVEGEFDQDKLNFVTEHDELPNSEPQRESGRRSWHFVKTKVPVYQWDMIAGSTTFVLKPDTMPAGLKAANWYYDLATGGRDRIRVDFPLHLWGEVGKWWSGL